MKTTVLACALAGVITTTGCGLTNDPARGLNFQPPPSWGDSGIRLLGSDSFSAPSDRGVIVLSAVAPGPNVEQRILNGSYFRNARQTHEKQIAICGNERAQYTTALVYARWHRGDMRLEIVRRDRPHDALVAYYAYTAGSKPDKEAEASIRELCPIS